MIPSDVAGVAEMGHVELMKTAAASEIRVVFLEL
jgi:hypothetical protein